VVGDQDHARRVARVGGFLTVAAASTGCNARAICITSVPGSSSRAE
jgi:hypothetical protein